MCYAQFLKGNFISFKIHGKYKIEKYIEKVLQSKKRKKKDAMRDWNGKAPTEGRPSEEEVYFLKYASVKELLSKIY